MDIPGLNPSIDGLGTYTVESKAGAIACMLLSLLCLGTWPALLVLLERRGRLPQHTYLDYSFANLLAAIVIAFLFGEIGGSKPEAPSFNNQLTQIHGPQCCLQWRVEWLLASGTWHLSMP